MAVSRGYDFVLDKSEITIIFCRPQIGQERRCAERPGDKELMITC